MIEDDFYGADPAFYDDSDYIKCDVCGVDYDYKEYRSLVCVECENEEVRSKMVAKYGNV